MGNIPASNEKFLMEMSRQNSRLLDCGMGKLPKRQYRQLYLAEWIEATGRDITGAAKAGDVDPSYISNLSGGRRANPSAHVLYGISEYLGITINDLYKPVPAEGHVSAMRELSPAAREALLNKPRSRD